MSKIHPSALIDEKAQIADDVCVGAFSIIGPHVKVGPGTIISDHVKVDGHTTIGSFNQIGSFSYIGAPPQDLSYKDESTQTVIGDHNIFREYVSIHRGTKKDKEVTKVGNHNLLMSYVHLGHDVVFGDHCIVANSTNFAGHVKVGDKVIIGGGCNISQFISLGRGSYIGGASAIDRDIPLFCTAYGNRVRLKGINIIGLRRSGLDKQLVSEVVDFYRMMESSPLSPRAFVEDHEIMTAYEGNDFIAEMSAQIKESKIGIAPFMS